MQTLLFPWVQLGPARQGYNAGESSVPMTASPSDLSPCRRWLPLLAASLAAQLGRTAAGLGFRVSPARIAEVSWRLLGGLGSWSGPPPEASGNREPHLFSEESFEPHDYLHLVPEELRRALGQVMTPAPIARYILRAARV